MTAHLAALTQELWDRRQEHRTGPKLTELAPGLTLDQAYAIQDQLLARTLAEGEQLQGRKAGLTSAVKMRQAGVDCPIFGFLAGGWALANGGQMPISRLIQPRVEGEICFITGAPLADPDCTQDAALEAVAQVALGIEIVDSRYPGYRFDLPSVVADNCSSGAYVLGQPVALKDLGQPDHLEQEALSLGRNGQPLATGLGADVLGHPAAALAALVRHLAGRGQSLPAASLVFAGAVTPAFDVQAGDAITLSSPRLGQVSCTFGATS